MSEYENRRITEREKAVIDWRVGKQLSEKFDPASHNVEYRVARMLVVNYEVYSEAGANEGDAFEYSKMYRLSALVNRRTLKLIVAKGRSMTVEEIDQDLERSKIAWEIVTSKKKPWNRRKVSRKHTT